MDNEEVVVKKSVVGNGKVGVKTLRSDKVHSKESTKEKEHRSSERDKKNQGVLPESKIDSGTVDVEKDVANAERQMHDELRNHELDMELENPIRRRGDPNDKDKYHDDSRDAKESQPSRDDRTRSSSYKDEKQQDYRYRESLHDDMRKDKQKMINIENASMKIHVRTKPR